MFGLGPAGTGKTYLAVAMAVDMLMSGAVERIILSRPAVEAGERLGFLPGDLREKVDPYLRPLYDALHDMLPGEQVMKRLALAAKSRSRRSAFMRGRTLANAFVILDEAQNTTPVQMKMFLTRLGENARMAVTGDLSQIDLPPRHALRPRRRARDARRRRAALRWCNSPRPTSCAIRWCRASSRAYDRRDRKRARKKRR